MIGAAATGDRLLASAADPRRRILLTGAWVLASAGADAAELDVLVQGERIEAVGTGLGECVEDALRVELAGALLMPGLVDSHVHGWEAPLRGVASAADFDDYLAVTHHGFAWAFEPEDMAVAERLTAARALRAGTTTIVDNAHNLRTPAHGDAALDALVGTGIRAVFAAGAAKSGPRDGHMPEDVLRLRDVHGSGQDRVAIRLFDTERSLAAWRFAADHGLDLCVELGSWFPDLDGVVASGLMRPGHTYNHGSDLPDRVWAAIAASGAAVNLAPRSDSQYGLGAFAPVGPAIRHGIDVGISTDNETGYGADLFTEMRVLLTLERGLSFAEEAAGVAHPLPRWTPADVLRTATIGGARNAGLVGEIGVIEPGRKADLVVIALDDPNTWGCPPSAGTVVNFVDTANVRSVFVDGVVRTWDGRLAGIDEDALRRDGEACRERLMARLGVTDAEVRRGLTARTMPRGGIEA